MKTWLNLLFVSMLCLAGCGKSAAVPPIGDWTTFKSPDAPFSVLMPTKPKRQEQSVGGITVVMQIAELKDFAVLAGSNPMPINIDLKNKDQVKSILDEAVKGGMNAQKATVKEQRELTLQGKYPCRDVTASVKIPNGSTGTIRLRIALLPDKLIQVLVVGDTKAMQEPQIKECLESLKITK